MERRYKTKILDCIITPGAGPKYKLPSCTGYIKHDPTRKTEPSYTIRKRTNILSCYDTPGPNKYSITNKTNRGVSRGPAYTIGMKESLKIPKFGPSPADYKVEKVPLVNHHKRSPAFMFGPNRKILLSTTLGDKEAPVAYTMEPKSKHIINDTPGPAAYHKVSIDKVKQRGPAYTMKFRTRMLKEDDIPGPKYLPKNLGKRAPTFACGIKHNPCVILPVTPADQY